MILYKANFYYDYSGGGTPVREWYVTDRLGSVTGLTDANGVSTAIHSYSTHGQPGATNEGRFQYTGQVWLEEVNLYYYKARFYDPQIKRFLNPDPIGYGDGMNMYAYVSGDPVNATDPSGMEGEHVCNKIDDPDCEVVGRARRQQSYEERQFILDNLNRSGGGFFSLPGGGAGLSTLISNLVNKVEVREKIACAAARAIVNAARNDLNGLSVLRGMLGGDAMRGTYLLQVNGDYVIGTGGSFAGGAYLRADNSDYGYFTSVSAAVGVDFDIGGAVLYTGANDINGSALQIEGGIGVLDIHVSTPTESPLLGSQPPQEPTIGVGVSYGTGGFVFDVSNITQATSCQG